MRAIILAAGRGTRLSPITNHIPKPLVRVANVPILEYQIENLTAAGIKEIVVVIGFKGAMIRSFCKKRFPSENINFIENTRYLDTNNMYSLYLCMHYLDSDIIIMNGDVIFEEVIIRKLMNQNNTSVCVDRQNYIEESMKVSVNKGIITDISKTIAPSESYGVSIDLYKICKSDLNILKLYLQEIIEVDKNLNDWTEVLLKKIFQEEKILAKPLDIGKSKWSEIDDYNDLDAAEQKFNKHLTNLKNKSLFFVDGDGTLYLGNKVFESGKIFLNILREKKKKFYLLTNNSSKTAYGHYIGLKEKNFVIELADILVSTDTLINFIKSKNYKNIYLVANKSVSKYFLDNGFILDETNPDCIILTYDDEITYQKLRKAALLIENGVPYYATHIDKFCPTEDGKIPDIGSYIELLRAVTGKLPLAEFGKPHHNIILHALKENEARLDDAVLVGDRLDTDIKMGENNNLTTILVLSGETKREDLITSNIQPDIIINNLETLAKYI